MYGKVRVFGNKVYNLKYQNGLYIMAIFICFFASSFSSDSFEAGTPGI